jgi:hypothetical protein
MKSMRERMKCRRYSIKPHALNQKRIKQHKKEKQIREGNPSTYIQNSQI